jgi:hypothetical protein
LEAGGLLNYTKKFFLLLLAACFALLPTRGLCADGKQPNIIFIMGDDIGWLNVGAYHQGLMSGRTPNLDKMATEGMRFTDYYAEASCTAGRAISSLDSYLSAQD